MTELVKGGVNVVSIHAFRGEGDLLRNVTVSLLSVVSIHAFRGEGDGERRRSAGVCCVSIHAFRGEGDAAAQKDF